MSDVGGATVGVGVFGVVVTVDGCVAVGLVGVSSGLSVPVCISVPEEQAVSKSAIIIVQMLNERIVFLVFFISAALAFFY